MIVAFDIDDTLYKVCRRDDCGGFHQIPDIEVLAILHWFVRNGDTVWVWSAGGLDYAKEMVRKLGIHGLVQVMPKQLKPWDVHPDICFDDENVRLAKANVQVKRGDGLE